MFVYPFCFPLSAGFNPRTHTGWRRRLLLDVVCCRSFNPRTTQGAMFWVVPCIVIMLVSIHAPTQGATNLEFACTYPARRFNPRTHTGCDRSPTPEVWNKVRFNPRTHTGCDKLHYYFSATFASFNPRTHTGCDIDNTTYFRYAKFQSTHPHGVRPL